MKIEEIIEQQKQLTAKWEARITELEEVIIKYPFEKMNYEGRDWRPLELERRKSQVEQSRLIVAALEKQIPKQVNPETMNEETGVIAEMECPVCGHLAIGKQYGANYCPWCGQRLKWGPICNTTKLPCAGCNPCCESRS